MLVPCSRMALDVQGYDALERLVLAVLRLLSVAVPRRSEPWNRGVGVAWTEPVALVRLGLDQV